MKNLLQIQRNRSLREEFLMDSLLIQFSVTLSRKVEDQNKEDFFFNYSVIVLLSEYIIFFF
ncbi:unnamed protein product [Brassica rapa subsp. trilocularis]